MPDSVEQIEPDTKDWTWVLERACDECGLDAPSLRVDQLPALLAESTMLYEQALARESDVHRRPSPGVWSVLEYACHVRDVHLLFAERLRSMLTEDEPEFAFWDQDETARQQRYDQQDPKQVAHELAAASAEVSRLYAGVSAEDEQRTGRRSDGSAFTVLTLGQYHLHDVLHHLNDIGWDLESATVRAYDEHAAAFRDDTAEPPQDVLELVRRFAGHLSTGSAVLEIGSGPGRDALLLEEAGLRVRRTDISEGFVALLREAGYEADLLDPLVDDLGGPWDGVWASACLLHVARTDLAAVLSRLAGATRAYGVLHASFKEGDGEGWSTHGSVHAPRHFVYWRQPALIGVFEEAGWQVEHVWHGSVVRGERWLDVIARRHPGGW